MERFLGMMKYDRNPQVQFLVLQTLTFLCLPVLSPSPAAVERLRNLSSTHGGASGPQGVEEGFHPLDSRFQSSQTFPSGTYSSRWWSGSAAGEAVRGRILPNTGGGGRKELQPTSASPSFGLRTVTHSLAAFVGTADIQRMTTQTLPELLLGSSGLAGFV